MVDDMTSRVRVREAVSADVESLAELKEEWAALPTSPTSAERADFTAALGKWMETHGSSVICYVAELDADLVGMAWLVIFERVPDIHHHQRRTGDIQSVYVQPDHRGSGIGSRLIAALVSAADELQIPRVTVSANSRAATLYEAHGFTATPTLLERRAP